MDKLLDLNIPIDLELLDNALVQLFQKNDSSVNDIIYHVFQRADFFGYVDKILQNNFSKYLKVMALQTFKEYVNLNWNSLPQETTEYFRNFIASYITSIVGTQSEDILPAANSTLLSILMFEWPAKWPQFIPNILDQARMSPAMCLNCLELLRILVEQFTNFADDSLTTIRQAEMNSAFKEQYSQLVPMVIYALRSQNDALIYKALSTIKIFLSSIPPYIVFTPDVVELIQNELLPIPKFTINCIYVICESPLRPMFNDGSTVMTSFFFSIVENLKQVFISDDIYNLNTDYCQTPKDFIHMFIVSITKFVGPAVLNNGPLEYSDQYSLCLQWLFMITEQLEANQRDEYGDFSELITFWQSVARSIYYDLGNNREIAPVYQGLFASLRRFVLRRMVSPNKDVLFSDENGIHYRRIDLFSQEYTIYNSMRETLVFLYHANEDDMLSAIYERLEYIKTTWDPAAVNSLSWAIGSIPGTISEMKECKLVAEIITTFMVMSTQLENIKDKAVVIGGILHVSSSYGSMFSRSNELLFVIINKMIEFTQQQCEAIQNAAAQALVQISKFLATPVLSVSQNINEKSFLERIFENINGLLAGLSRQNVILMIEFMSFLIYRAPMEQRKDMTTMLAQLANRNLQELAQNVQVSNPEWMSNIHFVIECDKNMIMSSSQTFGSYFIEICPFFVNIYSVASGALNQLASIPDSKDFADTQGLKSAIINLFTTFFDYNINDEKLSDVPNFFLKDYQCSLVKSPEILVLMSSVCQRNQDFFQKNYQNILSGLVFPTIPLLDYQGPNCEIWSEFCTFMRFFFSQNMDFLTADMESLMSMYTLLKRSIAHPLQTVSEMAVNTLSSLLSSLEYPPTTFQKASFLNTIAVDLFVFVVSVLIDGVHKYLFSNLMNLLRRMIQIETIQNRATEIFAGICELLPNKSPNEIYEFIDQMIKLARSQYSAFKDLIRNFLIESNKVAPNDPALYQKDFDEMKELLAQKKAVKGLVLEDQISESQMILGKLTEDLKMFSPQI